MDEVFPVLAGIALGPNVLVDAAQVIVVAFLTGLLVQGRLRRRARSAA